MVRSFVMVAVFAAAVSFFCGCDENETVAKAVWPAGYETEMNTQFDFVADFDVPSETNQVKLLVSGWYTYRVTLNDKFVICGPARTAKGWFFRDYVMLPVKKGNNRLKIEVAGYNCYNYYQMKQTPFLLAEVKMDKDKVLAHTGIDGDFKAYRSQRVQKVNRYSYQRTFAEVYRLPGKRGEALALRQVMPPRIIRRTVPMPDFELSEPLKPIQFSRVKEDPNAKIIDYRWVLLPNDPQRRDEFNGWPTTELEFNSADLAQRLAYSDKRAATAKDVAAAYKLKSGDSVTFDVGFNDTGFPGMTVKVAKPGRIVLTWDEILLRGEVHGCERYDSANIIVWDLTEPGVYELDAFEPYTMRYVEIGVLAGEMEVSRPRLRSYKNPTAKRAQFRASDSDLEKIFVAAKETFRQNAVDVYTDCPGRERAGWNCDAYFTSKVSTLLTGNTDLETAYELLFALPNEFDFLPEGMLPMCYPADHPGGGFIPNWAMWFVIQTEEYLKRSGDRDTVDALKPRFEKLVEFFYGLRNSDGLLEKLPSWVFVEWSFANRLTQDVNYPSNMLWAGMLDAMARLYGRKDLAEEAARVRETIRRQSWTGEWFCDNAVRGKDGTLKLSGECTETCQYYAFFFNVADPKSHGDLYKRLLTSFGPGRKKTKLYPKIHFSNAFIGNYLRLCLLARENRGAQILNETKGYFKKMADMTGTLWEHDNTSASCNHGFASYATVFLIENVLGVTNVDLQNKTVTLCETDVDLEWCEADLPVGSEMMHIGWRRTADGRKWDIKLPKGWKSVCR